MCYMFSTPFSVSYRTFTYSVYNAIFPHLSFNGTCSTWIIFIFIVAQVTSLQQWEKQVQNRENHLQPIGSPKSQEVTYLQNNKIQLLVLRFRCLVSRSHRILAALGVKGNYGVIALLNNPNFAVFVI